MAVASLEDMVPKLKKEYLDLIYESFNDIYRCSVSGSKLCIMNSIVRSFKMIDKIKLKPDQVHPNYHGIFKKAIMMGIEEFNRTNSEITYTSEGFANAILNVTTHYIEEFGYDEIIC